MILSGVDVLTEEQEEWKQAQRAREWFAVNGPADASPLPLRYHEREALKHGGQDQIIALFARSLAGQGYDWRKHPSFYDYACGVMASKSIIPDVKNDEELKRRYPPRQLKGLNEADLCWRPRSKVKR
jgi:hypothetical protein